MRTDRVLRGLAMALGTAATFGPLGGVAAAQTSPVAQTGIGSGALSAVDNIFEAFERRPLVGLGDRHGLAQGHMFYENVVSDARFARDVGNVVVEFGSATHQATIDRYVNGESVPYPELRRVWMDAVGWVPTVQGAYFAHFFFQIRQINAALSPESRIKVWLGEPPVDWSKIETSAQWRAVADTRDAHAADLIVRNILARNEKALIIYGAQHFEPLTNAERELFARHSAFIENLPRNLQNRIQQDHPDTFFVVQTYVGFADANCQARFEDRLKQWTLPALRTPVMGTPLEGELRACLPQRTVPAGRTVPQEWPTELRNYASTHVDDHVLFEGDAILFLAPAGELAMGPYLADIWLDDAYRAEIDRRMKIMVGQPLPADYARMIPTSMAFTQRDR